MRILIVSNLFPPEWLGGYELLCEDVALELQRRGHEVTVLTTPPATGPGPIGTPPRTDGIEVLRDLELYLPFDRAAGRLQRRRFRRTQSHNHAVTRRTLVSVRPDVVFLWSQLRLTLGPAKAAEDSGCPCVYTFNDPSISGYRPNALRPTPRAAVGYLIDRFLIPRITTANLRLERTTCISECLKRNLLADGMSLESSDVIYTGIPVDRFPVKEKPGAIGTPLSLLYVGQLHPYKGVHTLCNAAHLVAARRGEESVRVSIVGDGPLEYRNRLREIAENGPAQIELVGRVPRERVSDYYRNHDVLAFPSIWDEPFGLTHLEAMASGTTVLSTIGGGQGEFLKDGENCLVFAKEDEGELARAILRLLDEPELSETLAEEARDLVVRQFDIPRYVDELEPLLTGTGSAEAVAQPAATT